MRMAGRGGVVRPKLLGADLLTKLEKRVEKMADEIDAALPSAAAKATAESRRIFQTEQAKTGRPSIPARKGRRTTRGNFAKSIHWVPGTDAGGYGVVNLDIAAMEAAYGGGVPIWLINEIGTGASAFMERPDPNASVQARRVQVKSQVGRAIPFGLAWGTATGKFVRPGGGTKQQLYPVSTLRGVPADRTRIRISEEIKPKHYLRDGGTEGFRQFEQSALAAAYAAFDKRQFR